MAESCYTLLIAYSLHTQKDFTILIENMILAHVLVCALWVCNSQCNNHYSFNFTWRDCLRYLERRCIFATVISLMCVGGMGTKWNMFGRWECCCFSKNRRGIKPRDTRGLMTNWFSVMVIVSWKDNGVTVFTAKSDGQWDLILKKKKKKVMAFFRI